MAIVENLFWWLFWLFKKIFIATSCLGEILFFSLYRVWLIFHVAFVGSKWLCDVCLIPFGKFLFNVYVFLQNAEYFIRAIITGSAYLTCGLIYQMLSVSVITLSSIWSYVVSFVVNHRATTIRFLGKNIDYVLHSGFQAMSTVILQAASGIVYSLTLLKWAVVDTIAVYHRVFLWALFGLSLLFFLAVGFYILQCHIYYYSQRILTVLLSIKNKVAHVLQASTIKVLAVVLGLKERLYNGVWVLHAYRRPLRQSTGPTQQLESSRAAPNGSSLSRNGTQLLGNPTNSQVLAANTFSTFSLCIVCMHQERNILIEPCCHLCVCAECSSVLLESQGKCPLCRRRIQTLTRVYL